MNRKTTIIIALQAFLIVMLFWVLVYYGKDEYEAYIQGEEIEEEVDTRNRVSFEQGVPIVTLPAAAREQSGIVTVKLAASERTSTLRTYGTVIGIDGLLELRSRYLGAAAEINVARAALAGSQQEFDRLHSLNQDDHNVSDQAVARAEATFKADQAKLQLAESNTGSLHDSMRQQWGAVLTTLASQSTTDDIFNRFLQHREVLLQVTFPFDTPAPIAGNTIRVAPAGFSGVEIPAWFVSAAPVADQVLTGTTYYYRAPADRLRIGMPISVTLKKQEDEDTLQGVTVPTSAIVWYSGQPWVYRRDDDDRFTRLPVRTDQETDGGWFNHTTGLQPGDEIVITGAQLLLSEEFKYQIDNENDD